MTPELPPYGLSSKKAKGNVAIVYVSLYFLLIAFFIYLHSISAPNEDKVQQVIGSIDFAFKGLEQKNKIDTKDKLTGDEFGLAVFHAEIKRVFETAIPLIESRVNEKGDELQFVVPIAQLFGAGSAALRSTRDELFSEAARILIKRSGITPTDMEILIDAGDKLPAGEEAKASIDIQRVNALVTSFLENGVPGRNIFIGMMSEGTGNIYFKFYIRSSFENQFRKVKED